MDLYHLHFLTTLLVKELIDYNATNYESGRENCMKACSYTNCIAVQTEVPENCSQETSPTGSGDACGSNAGFSCTLFYNNIQDADDGYWLFGNYSNSVGNTRFAWLF